MPEPLPEAALATALAVRPAWSGGRSGIRRRVVAPDFLTGIHLVDDVAVLAERLGHHPDIDIRWRTLTFACSTHSVGAVTALDLELADEIDMLVVEHGAVAAVEESDTSEGSDT